MLTLESGAYWGWDKVCLMAAAKRPSLMDQLQYILICFEDSIRNS